MDSGIDLCRGHQGDKDFDAEEPRKSPSAYIIQDPVRR